MSTPRRSFLKVVFGVVSGALAVVIGGPITAAFLDPAGRRTVTGGGDATRLGKLADFLVGIPRKLDVITARNDAWDRSDPKPIGSVWLVRRDDKKLDCFSGTCPHLGCAIGYDAGKKQFVCPCHDSAFSLDDGQRLKGPSPRGLDPLPVHIKDNGEVEVTYKQFVQGIPSRKEA
jgi:menaquinol-cytochrome c reductase iron-sulfur subunit